MRNMKRLTIALLILFALVGGTATVAQANMAPVYAVDNLYSALNQGQVEQALTTFEEGAQATNALRDQTYAGLDEIETLLADWAHEDRTYEIVYLEMAGDQVTARVNIADYGHVWAQQTIETTVAPDGKLEMLEVTSFLLELSRINRLD